MDETKAKKQEVVFARPVFSAELLTEEAKKRFDALPAWQRHLVKRIIDHGDLPKAAHEAGVSRYVKDHVDENAIESVTVVEELNKGGLTTAQLVAHLQDCLEAKEVQFDKHRNPIRTVNLQLKLKTLELIFKLRGDFEVKQPKKPLQDESLFPEDADAS